MSQSISGSSKTFAMASAGIVGAFILVLLLASVIPGVGQLSVPALTHKPVQVSDEVFPDPGLRSYVQSYIDRNGDGYLSNSEISAVKTIGNYDKGTFKVTDAGLTGAEISSLKGIERFYNLETLVCQDSTMEELDISGNPSLKYVDMRGNSSFAISYTHANEGTQILVSENSESWGSLSELNIVQA